jgi:hypothetical protein
MRIPRSAVVGSAALLVAALAACGPVESLDDESETPAVVESPSASDDESPTAEESETETESATDEAEDETTEAPTGGGAAGDIPTEDVEEEPSAPADDAEEPSSDAAPPTGGQTVSADSTAGPVSYTVPDGWNDLSFAYEGHPTITLAAAPVDTAANGTQFTATVIQGGASSFEAYRAALEEQAPAGAEMSAADPLTVDGQSVQGLRVVTQSPEGEFVQYTYPVFRSGYQWEIQFAVDPADESAALPGLRAVGESITFG